jgi:ABC-2 type transport system ATP-binding protein
MTDFAIEVRNLFKTYRHGWMGRKRIDAIRDVTLCVNRGELFGLLGPNGAGKTTLVKTLLGIVHFSRGEAKMLGHPVRDKQTRRRVGYMPENLRVASHQSGQLALEFYGQLHGLRGKHLKMRCDEVLELVGLTGRQKELASGYSKGMGQRLSLAQALLHDPDILFLDEPTDGLDPGGRRDVRVILQRIKQQGKTVFLNSHLLQEVESICDRVAIMAKGQVRGVGSVSELTRQSSFGINMRVAVPDANVDQVIALLKNMQLQPIRDGDLLRMQLTEPAQADAVVDAIRQQKVSILRLTVDRGSLEDVFMHLVAGQDRPSDRPIDRGQMEPPVLAQLDPRPATPSR